MSVCDHFHRVSVRYVMVSLIVTAYTDTMFISWLIVISTSALFWYCALMAI